MSENTLIRYSAIYGKLKTNINGHTATCKLAINVVEITIPSPYRIFLGFSKNFSIKYIINVYIINVTN